MSKFIFTDEELINATRDSLSIANVCRILGLKPNGGNYKTLKYKFKELNIDTSHFTGQGWNIGMKFNPHRVFTIKDALIKNSPCKSSSSIKRLLLKNNLKEYKCEICGLTEWMGKQITLELHHINGDNMDNRLENLQLLCPNCHSMTDNFRGKNLQNHLSIKREEEYNKYVKNNP